MLWISCTVARGHQIRPYQNMILFLVSNIPTFTKATTEWFGDSRAYMSPSRPQPFQDIIYDISG